MIKLEPNINWVPFDNHMPPADLCSDTQYLIFLREDNYDDGATWTYSVDIATPYGRYLDDFWNTEHDWKEGQRVEVLAYAELPYAQKEEELVKSVEYDIDPTRKMIIIVSCCDFINVVKDLMIDIAKRLSIVRPRIYFKEYFIEIKLETMPSIKIIFVPALQEKVKGTIPDYYWTDSYYVDKYYRCCPNVKCLQNFTELTNLVLTECQKDEENWRLMNP